MFCKDDSKHLAFIRHKDSIYLMVVIKKKKDASCELGIGDFNIKQLQNLKHLKMLGVGKKRHRNPYALWISERRIPKTKS